MKNPKQHSQSGIAALAAVLIIAAVGIIGYIGWKVYQDNNAAKQNAGSTQQAAETPTAAKPDADAKKNPDTQQYLSLDKWGVRAPYEASVKLTVKDINDQRATITSEQFLARNIECLGGVAASIDRYAPNEYVTDNRQKSAPTDRTAADIYANNNLDAAKLYKAGNYYYLYRTAEGPCDVTQQMAQDPTANAAKASVSKLEAIPSTR